MLHNFSIELSIPHTHSLTVSMSLTLSPDQDFPSAFVTSFQALTFSHLSFYDGPALFFTSKL